MEHLFRMHPFVVDVRMAARISVIRNVRSRVRQLARRRRVTSILFEVFNREISTPWIATFLVVDEAAAYDLRFSFLYLVFLKNTGHGSWLAGVNNNDVYNATRMRRFIDAAYSAFDDLFEPVDDFDDGFWD